MSQQSKITIKALTQEMVRELNAFNQDVYLEIVRTTPKRTGAAGRAWTRPEPVSATDFNKVISTNTLPYIPRLEAGSSKQAPAGFIQQSIDKIIRRYRR